MARGFRPVWNGEGPFFEIWFLVAWDESGRAIWLRHTTFAPKNGEARATVWAALFENDCSTPRFVGKSIHSIAEYRTDESGEGIVIGDARLETACATGSVTANEQTLAWDLAFEAIGEPAPRMPAIVERLPTPTKGHAIFFDAMANGAVTLDGERVAWNGRALAMHLHGTRRVDALTWMAACAGTRSFEMTSVRPVKQAGGLDVPPLTTIVMEREGRPAILRTGLREARNHRLSSPRPGLVIAEARGRGTRLVARGWAPLETFAGYAYRDPGDGHDVFVGQSDVASIVVEEYARSTPLAPFRPVAQTVFPHAALEHHDLAPIAGVPTIQWDERAIRPAQRARDAKSGPLPTHHVPWPEVRAIVALGLTYRDHIQETGGDPRHAADAVVAFEKRLRTFLPAGDRVRIPAHRALVDDLDAIEPGLARELERRYAFLPAIMDYEVELGVVMLDDGELGYFLANDLTARSAQILGEGRAAPLPYWAVAKSFAGFCPTAPSVYRPPGGALPDVEITTRVNGTIRQTGSTRDLVIDLPRIRAIAERTLGRALAPGDAILTGTPSGVALQVPAWKKRLGDKLFDRFGKLDRAISMAVTSGRFLGHGDVVEVAGGPLGTRAVTLVHDVA